MSRAKTAEEVRKELFESIQVIVGYWSRRDMPEIEKLEGVVFSMLNIIDGTSAGFPAFNLTLGPSPDYKREAINQGENYFEDGMTINADCYLHDEYFPRYSLDKENDGDPVGAALYIFEKMNREQRFEFIVRLSAGELGVDRVEGVLRGVSND